MEAATFFVGAGLAMTHTILCVRDSLAFDVATLR